MLELLHLPLDLDLPLLLHLMLLELLLQLQLGLLLRQLLGLVQDHGLLLRLKLLFCFERSSVGYRLGLDLSKSCLHRDHVV